MKPLILSLLLFSPLVAQQPPEDPMRDVLFPPEAVMQHQQAIGLNDEQKNNLKTEVRQAQTKFTELQWTLQDEVERLVALLKQPKVDEKQAAAELDKVLAAEREIKRTQLMLLIRIKNNLTPAQQVQLRELVDKSKSK
ncbi:MAG TPA: periplasmic heavy metal sensor [Bryobacteraceae bacterium]|nr:periplasmic heavy metal sensor [Bryobacteraceae bacterium]